MKIAGLQGNGRDKMFRMVELLLLLLPRTVSIRTHQPQQSSKFKVYQLISFP